MPRVNFLQSDGSQRSIEVPAGLSVMQAAVNNDVPGIAGECGGCVSCATCKVHLPDAWLTMVGEPGELERSLIEDEGPNVRLSCQINVTDALDGLIVHVPASQYR